jgi:peptidoglycan/xylan/chitin deacetylase (PgdA/CDA1 family)
VPPATGRRHDRFLAATLGAAIAATGLLAGCAVRAPGTATSSAGTPTTSAATDVPTPGGPSAPAPSRPPRPTLAPAPTFSTYTVRPGDSLIALADRFGTTPESLALWNRARYPSLDPTSPAYQPGRIEAGWQLAYLPGEVADSSNVPPVSAAPTGTPGVAGPVGPYPVLPADGGAALVSRGPDGLDGVALTFDYAGGAGLGPGGAEAVVAWLEANGVPATVFVGPPALASGDAAGSGVLARLRASKTIRVGLLAPVDAAVDPGRALAAAEAPLAAALGKGTAPWLRPSDGRAPSDALLGAGRAGWRWVVTWDVDPGDGVPTAAAGPSATDIVTRVVSRAVGGSIVRLHLGGEQTLDALPGIVDGLTAAGLRVVPLPAILGLPTGG